MTWDAIDLFAGPGGWDLAACDLGIHVLGVEIDAATVRTRRAAGLQTIESDVRQCREHVGQTAGLIASPPCQTFSTAGMGTGAREMDKVLRAVGEIGKRRELHSAQVFSDPRTGLVLEPLRWALAALDADRPYRWVALEQVPAVLPVWERVASILRSEGYASAAGRLSAEQYGVPQTRKRAVLVARLDGKVELPVPTHRLYRKGVPKHAGDQSLLPWVSMAEALGWGMTLRPSYTLTAGGTGRPGGPSGGAEPYTHGTRKAMYEEFATGNWVLRSGQNSGGISLNRPMRALTEPALTITTNAGSVTWVQKDDRPKPRIFRLTEGDAGVLQTFPSDFPWQGTKGQRFQQIGNAIPPLLARAVLAQVVDG